MEINITQEIHKDSFMSHLILHGLTYAVKENLVNDVAEKCHVNGGNIDVKLLVEGEEINLESFVAHWQRFIDDAVTKAAHDLINDKFNDINETLYQVQEELNYKFRELLQYGNDDD